MNIQRRVLVCAIALLSAAPLSLAATARNWHSGKLTDSEQTKELQGTTYNNNSQSSARDHRNHTDYSEHSTSTSTDNYDTFQIYTIEHGQKIYTVRERLLFPWSKPANVTVGEAVKYAIEKNKIYLLDDDGKEHKATLVRTSLKSEH